MSVLRPNEFPAMHRDKVLWARMEKQFRKPRIVLHKDSWFLRVMHFFLKLVTRKEDFGGFTTTIGRTMYVPNSWYLRHPDQRYKTLRHERRHMLQFRRWPMAFLDHRGVWRINALIFGFCYLLVLPFKLTLRAKFEREGYVQTALVLVELGELDPSNPQHRASFSAWMENTFGTGTYFWMARKGVGRKFAYEVLDAIALGILEADEEEIVKL